MQIHSVGIDLGKTAFHLVALSAAGEVLLRKKTALCALPVNYLFMRKPIDGRKPVTMAAYTGAPARWHMAGVLGGAIWVCGATLNFVASRVNFVGPAISYSIGQGATMVSAFWGVFVWREFASPSSRVRNLLVAMFACFLAGLVAIAVAPLYPYR